METSDVLRNIYDSEINFKISAFWDAGFDWALGDPLNGFLAEGCELTLSDALTELVSATLEHFPQSVFAKNYQRG